MPKYSKKLAKTFCETLSRIGRIEATCEAVGIDHSTYYVWLKRHPDFKEMVDVAKREYHTPDDFLDLRRLAQEKLKQYLIHGVRETSIVTETKRDRDGEIISTNTKESVTVRETPSWVISRFVAPAEPELQHLTKLMDIGAIPIEFVELIYNHLEEFGKKLEATTGVTSPLLKGKIEEEPSNNLDDFLERLKRTGGDDNA